MPGGLLMRNTAVLAKIETTYGTDAVPTGAANAVLVSEDDWNAIQETLYLLSVPGMRESIKEGMAQPASKLAKKLDW